MTLGSNYVRYKGKVYRAVDNIDIDQANKVVKAVNEVKSDVTLWNKLIYSWIQAYNKGDLAQCNSIKNKLSASVGKLDIRTLDGTILPLFKL